MAGKIYVATQDGLADYDGRQVPLRAGVTRVREGHPLLKGREAIFKEITVDYDIEDARSAPQDETKAEPKVNPMADAFDESGGSEPEPEAEAPAKPVSKPRTQRGPRKAAGS